jgi:hypothetical protein
VEYDKFDVGAPYLEERCLMLLNAEDSLPEAELVPLTEFLDPKPSSCQRRDSGSRGHSIVRTATMFAAWNMVALPLRLLNALLTARFVDPIPLGIFNTASLCSSA